jgi:hypothetical protein
MDMLCLCIRHTVYRHGFNAHQARRCHDATGNFTAIGNEDS